MAYRVGEDWMLGGKVLKQTDKLIFQKGFVLVDKENFMQRRSGIKVYGKIKSLDNL